MQISGLWSLDMNMRAVTIRDVPEEVHRAIRVRAALHGRTLQAEMLDILGQAVKPEGRVKLGDLLVEIGKKINLTDEELSNFERDSSPAGTVDFL